VFTRRSYTRKTIMASFMAFGVCMIYWCADWFSHVFIRPCSVSSFFNVGLIVITLIAFNYKFLIKRTCNS
jgi:uncharacterized membrane-anchored protein